MRLSLLISLSLLLLSWTPARAQLAPADDFFNNGARLYISNNIPQAKDAVEMGLKLYPGDDKLKKLEELLKQQQQQQQQQSQQNQSQQSQQQKSDSQKNQQQQQQSSSKNSQDQQKQDEQKQTQASQKKDEQQKQQEQQQQAAAQKKDGEKPDQPDASGQPVAAGQMTPEEAKRLLDAQKDDEQLLQMKPAGKPRDDSHPVKDW